MERYKLTEVSPYFSYITMRDYLERTKSIWEKVTGCDINIHYDGSSSKKAYVEGDTRKAIIGLSGGMEDFYKKLLFHHESAHILFDSLVYNFHMTSKGIFRDNLPDDVKNMGLDSEITELFKNVMNVLDDQRVESLMGELYYGTGKDFIREREKIGKEYKAECDNPISALYYARNFREDLIPKKWREPAIKAMKDVELTAKEGTLVVSKDYIKKQVIPYVLENLPEKMPEQNEKPVKGRDVNQKLKGDFRTSMENNYYSDHKNFIGTSGNDDKIDEGNLKQLKEEGITRVGDIKEKIEKQARTDNNLLMPNADKIVLVNRSGDYNDFEVDFGLASSLNKVLRTIQAKRKPKLKDAGEILSIPAVINRRARGYGDKLFIDEKRISHLTIMVSIDASGSMNGYRLETARDMMATMYKGVEGIKGINIRGVVWGGGFRDKVGITNITKLKDCTSIKCHSGYGGTPTPYAVEYSARTLERMKGKKKLLVVITDGCPNSVSGGKSAYELTYDEVKRARSKKIGVIGMFIGSTHAPHMEELFGMRGYIAVRGIEEASSKILTKFRELVIEQVGKN